MAITADQLWSLCDALQVRVAELEARVEQLTAALDEIKAKEQSKNGN
jgi:uncharacterized protein YlxW (UPF0749 family)